MIIRIDGTQVKVIPADLDKNGKRGGIELVEQNEYDDIVPITNTTELGDSLKELNKDTIEGDNRMSGIDMRSRLHPIEVSNILALDSLVGFAVLPTKCLAFTRQKKRLSVSQNGTGRTEIVQIVAGKRELEAKTGQNFKEAVQQNMLGVKKNENA